MPLCSSDLFSEVSVVRSLWYLLCAGVERSSWQGRCNGDRPLWRYTCRATPACGRLGNASQIPLCQSCTDGRLEWCALRHSPVETSLPTTNKANIQLNCILQQKSSRAVCLSVSSYLPVLPLHWSRSGSGDWPGGFGGFRMCRGQKEASRTQALLDLPSCCDEAQQLWPALETLVLPEDHTPLLHLETHTHTNCASPLSSHRLLLPATK